ncbi:hypothetical protein [Amycolatopsis japonica]
MTLSPHNYPEGLPPLDAGCWSDLVRAIELDGGPITPHPDPETLRRRARFIGPPRPTTATVTAGSVVELGAVSMPDMDLDEDPPASLPARPYNEVHRDVVIAEVLKPRRAWLSRALRRFT